MTQEGYERSCTAHDKQKIYDELEIKFRIFEDISSMSPHLMIFRNRIGTTAPAKLMIGDKIMEAGIKAMTEEYKKELEQIKKEI